MIVSNKKAEATKDHAPKPTSTGGSSEVDNPNETSPWEASRKERPDVFVTWSEEVGSTCEVKLDLEGSLSVPKELSSIS
jgi:hypothetical protein